MIERVAKAIYGDLWEEFEDQEHMKQKMLSASRAAIEAMREPTDAMLACSEQWGLPSDPMGLKRWQEMIDAALEGK
jgi:hypothetical protein